VCINPLPSDRLCCCNRYIRCQRSLAVKPLTMSGSPSPCIEWAGLKLPMYRYQTAAARCAMTANWCRRAETTAARGAAVRPLRVQWRFLNGCARRLGPFSTAGAHRLRAFVHYRSSHNRAKRDCGLYPLFSAYITILHILSFNFILRTTVNTLIAVQHIFFENCCMSCSSKWTVIWLVF